MKTKSLFAAAAASLIFFSSCCGEKKISLKESYGDQFLIGAALNVNQVAGKDSIATAIVKQHYNCITPENCMKCAEIHPQENVWNFEQADALVDFAEANDLTVIGHCLIWHSQCAPWFFVGEDGKEVTPEVLKARMKTHITTLVSRYKGRIHGWDVVNEAIIESGKYRNSKFYQILGEEFIPLAFQYAHEADPDVELYYNDYGMANPGRRGGVVKMIKDLKARGLRIDAVGMQAHIGMEHPSLEQFEESMLAFHEAGVNVMITEWDQSALINPKRSSNIADTTAYQAQLNPYTDGLPQEVSDRWNENMKAFFNLFLKHSDFVTRVTTWGVYDKFSWKNDFPVKGRTDYPLLFDRQGQPKQMVIDLCSEK